MKTTTKFILAALGVGIGVLFLTGCHHFGGGGCGYAPAPAPAPVATATVPANTPVNSSIPSTPAQPNAPTGHQH